MNMRSLSLRSRVTIGSWPHESTMLRRPLTINMSRSLHRGPQGKPGGLGATHPDPAQEVEADPGPDVWARARSRD